MGIFDPIVENGELDRNNQPIKRRKSSNDIFQVPNEQIGSAVSGGRIDTFSNYETSFDDAIQFSPGQNREAVLSATQSGWQQTANALAQGASTVVLGGLEGLSYFVDADQAIGIVKGTEQEYTNWFAESMKQAQESVKEFAPIYRSEAAQTGFAPGDASWWAYNAESIATSLSLMIPAYGMTALASGASKLMKINKALKTIATPARIKGISSAVFSRYAENTMEANETFNSSYQQLLQQGVGDEEARMRAGEAASKAWNTNWVNLATDVIQYNVLSKGSNMATQASKEFREGLGDRAFKFARDVTAEGLEEGGQFTISKEAERTALDKKASYFELEGLGGRLSDYIEDPEFKAAVTLGAVGGGFFSGAQQISDTVGDRTERLQDAALAIYAGIDKHDLNTVAKAKGGLLLNEIYKYASEGKLNDLKEHYKQVAEVSDADLEADGWTKEAIADKKVADKQIAEDLEYIGEQYVNIFSDKTTSEAVKKEQLASFYTKRLLGRTMKDIEARTSKLKTEASIGTDSLHIDLMEQLALNKHYIEGKRQYNDTEDSSENDALNTELNFKIKDSSKKIAEIKKSLTDIGKLPIAPSFAEESELDKQVMQKVENEVQIGMTDNILNKLSTKKGQEVFDADEPLRKAEAFKNRVLATVNNETSLEEQEKLLNDETVGAAVKAKLTILANAASKGVITNPTTTEDFLERYASKPLLKRELAAFAKKGLNVSGITDAQSFVDKYNSNKNFKDIVDRYFENKILESFNQEPLPDIDVEANQASPTPDNGNNNQAREISFANKLNVQSNPYVMYTMKDGKIKFLQTKDVSITKADPSTFENLEEGGPHVLYDNDGEPIRSELNTIEIEGTDNTSAKTNIEKRRTEELDKLSKRDRFQIEESFQKDATSNVEVVKMIGKKHSKGNQYKASFQDHTSKGFEEDPYMMIINVRKPQINTDGVMTQGAEVLVGHFDSKEAGEKYLKNLKEQVKQKESKINSKYDTELAALNESTSETIELVSDETFLALDDVNTKLIGNPITFTMFLDSTYSPTKVSKDDFTIITNTVIDGKLVRIGTLRTTKNTNDSSDNQDAKRLRQAVYDDWKASGETTGEYTSGVTDVIIHSREVGDFAITQNWQSPHTILNEGEPLFFGAVDTTEKGEVDIHTNSGEVKFRIPRENILYRGESELADRKGAIVMFVKMVSGMYHAVKLYTTNLSEHPKEQAEVYDILDKLDEKITSTTNVDEIAKLIADAEIKVSKNIYLKFKYEKGKYHTLDIDKKTGEVRVVSEAMTLEEFKTKLETKVMNIDLDQLNTGNYNEKVSQNGWLKSNLPKGNHTYASMVHLKVPKVFKNTKVTSEKVTKTEAASVSEVKDIEYNNFIDKGEVTKERINSLVQKVKNNATLSSREMEMFTDKTSEINAIIAAEPQKEEIEVSPTPTERPKRGRSTLRRNREVTEDVYEVWDEKTETKWFKETYPNTPLTVLDDMKSIGVAGGVDLWGLFTNSSVYISKNAKTGTAYHEAFHVVFNTLLTPNERKDILTNTKDKTKGLINKEEELADLFMEYKLTEGNATEGLTAKVLDFFKRLYHLIQIAAERVGLKNAPSLNSYFYRIDRGSYGKFKVPAFTKNVTRFSVKPTQKQGYLNPREKTLSIALLNGILLNDVLNEYRDELNIPNADDLTVIKKVIAHGKNTKYNDYSLEGMYSRVYDFVKEEHEVLTEELADENTIKELDKLLLTLGKPNATTSMIEFTPFMERVVNGLKIHGIKITSENKAVDSFESIEDDTQAEEESTVREGWQDKGRFDSAIDKFSQKFKALLAKIPTKEGKFGGFATYEPTNTTRNTLLTVLPGSKTEAEMLQRVKDLVVKFPNYEILQSELENDKGMLREVWRAIGQRSNTSFVTAQIKRYTNTNKTTGEKTFNVESSVFESNRQSIHKDIIAQWQNQLYTSKDFNAESNTVSIKHLDKAIEKLTAIQKDYNKASNTSDAFENAEESAIKTVSNIMNYIHIPITEAELSHMFAEGTSGRSKLAVFLGNPNSLGLINVVSTMQRGVDPYAQGSQNDRNALTTIAKAIAEFQPSMSQVAFVSSEGKMVYPTLQARFATDHLNRMKGIANKETIAFFKEYKSDPYFKYSSFLDDMANNPSINLKTRIAIFDGVNEDGKKKASVYSEMSKQQLESTKMNLWFNRHPDRKVEDPYGYYQFPVLADVGTMMTLYHKKFTMEEVTERLRSSAKQERSMIQWVNKQIEPVQEKFDNWLKDVLDEKVDVKDIRPLPIELQKIPTQLLINGRKYNTFTIFNEETFDDEDGFNDLVDKFTKQKYEEELQSMFDENILSKNDKGFITDTSNTVDSRFFKNTNNLEKYIYNSMYMNFQLMTVFTGDIAYYKGKGNVNMEDVFKRVKQIYSPGERLGVDINNTFNGVNVRPEYHIAYVRDATEQNKIVTEHKAIIEKTFPGEANKNVRAAFGLGTKGDGLNNTDAATWIDIFRLREIYLGTEQWTDAHNDIYNSIMEGKSIPANAAIIMNPIKPFVYGHTKVNINKDNNLIIPFQHKNAEFLLLPQMAKGNPQMQAILEKMGYTFKKDGSFTFDTKKRVIDALMYTSAVKVGQYDVLGNINEVTNLNKHTFSNADYSIQMATPQHHLDAKNLYGSQFRKLLMQGIEMDKDYFYPDGTSITGKDLFNQYQEYIQLNLQASADKLKAEWHDESGTFNKEKFVNRLREEIKDKEYGDYLLEALDWLDDSKTKTVLPLWHPTIVDMVEKMFNSFYKNGITKQPINGASLYNASSHGLEKTNDKGLRKPEIKFNEDKSINYFEAIMPITSKRVIQKYMNSDGTIDIERLNKVDQKLLMGIFYRIPTESYYSMFHIKVIGYTPSGMIILPDEITTIAGLDFDIDKLYGLLYNLEKAEGELLPDEYAKWETADNTPQINTKTGRTFTKSNISGYDPERGRIDYAKRNELEWDDEAGSFRKETEIKAVVSGPETKESRDNMIIDIAWAVLSSEYTMQQQLSVGNFDTYKSAKDAVLFNQPSNTKKDLNILRLSTGREVFERNMTGLKLIGITANHTSNHSLMIHGDFYFRDSIKINGYNESSLSNEKNKDGARIGKNLAEGSAFTVDNAKDPLSSFLNITTVTIDVVIAMQRTGVDIDTSVAFIANPILRKFTRYEQALTGKDSKKEAVIRLKAELREEMSKRKFNEFNAFHEKGAQNTLTLNVSFNKDGAKRYTGSLGDSIKTEGKKLSELTENELYVQNEVLILFSETLEKANALAKTMGGMRYDSLTNAPTGSIAHTEVLARKVEIAESYSDVIIGFKEFFEGGKIPYVAGFYNLGVKPVKNDYLKATGSPYAKDNGIFKEIIDLFNSYSEDGLTPEEMNDLYRMTMTSFATDFQTYTHSEMKRVMSELPSRITAYNKANPEGAFSIFMRNFIVVNVKYDKETGEIKGDKRVASILFNRLGKDRDHQDELRNVWQEMLYSSKPEEVQIAKDLDKYAFFSTGFTFGKSTFKDLVPITYMSELVDDKGVTFTGHLQKNFDSETFTPEQKMEIVTQIVRNKYRTMYSVPMLRLDEIQEYELLGEKGNRSLTVGDLPQLMMKSTNPIYTASAKNPKELALMNKNPSLKRVDFIKVPIQEGNKTEMILMKKSQFIEGIKNQIVYREIQRLGVHNETIEMSLPHAVKGVFLESFYNELIKQTLLDLTKVAASNVDVSDYTDDINFGGVVKPVVKPIVINNKIDISVKNIFTVKPIQSVDTKAVHKASIATQYIGFAEGIEGSSTGLYAKQAGKFANTGNYNPNDIIFVSVGGKRGNETLRAEQQTKTIKEAIKAIEAGASIITDNKDYVDSNSYNEGEKRLKSNLETKGYKYSEITVEGHKIGVWNKVKQETTQPTSTVTSKEGIITDSGVNITKEQLNTINNNFKQFDIPRITEDWFNARPKEEQDKIIECYGK